MDSLPLASKMCRCVIFEKQLVIMLLHRMWLQSLDSWVGCFTPVIAIDGARDYELRLGLNPNLLLARSLPGYLASLSLSFLFYCM